MTEGRQWVGVGVETLTEINAKSLLDRLPGMGYRCRWDGQWTMEWVSRGSARVSGHTPRVLVSQVSWIDLIHPNDVGRVLVEIEEALRKEEAFQIVYRIFTPPGSERWVMEDGRGIGRTGEARHVEGFISAITTQGRRDVAPGSQRNDQQTHA